MKNLLLPILLSLSAAAQAGLPDLPTVRNFDGVSNITSVLAGPDESVLIGDASLAEVVKYCPLGTVQGSYSPGATDPTASAGLLQTAGTAHLLAPAGFLPAGMDIDAYGRLVVADSKGNRLEIFNPDGSLAGYIGVETEEDELIPETPEREATEPYLAEPQAVAFGPQGRLYVADAGHNRVAVFSATTGAYLFAWGTPGYTGNYQMSYPMGIAVANGKVYVADAGNARVLVYDTEGVYLRTIGRRGLGLGEFDSPFGLGVDGEGRLWVADNGAQKVVVFDADGQPVKEYGQWVNRVYFEDLRGIYVSKAGKVLTADGAGGKVYTWETGVAFARYDGKETPVLAGTLSDALLAFGPVPARAGQTLHMQVPFQAQELSWELYTADMRRVDEGHSGGRSSAEIVRTADLSSGVYLVKMNVAVGGASRSAVQKIIITR